MDSWSKSAFPSRPLSLQRWIPGSKVPPIWKYRQEQGFALARLPLQASGNDHKPQRHDSGCHRQEPSKALVNTVMTDGFVGLGLAMAIPVVKP